MVNAHLLAMEKAGAIGFGRYIISATTPFTSEDLFELRMNAPAVTRRKFPDYEEIYEQRGWTMFPSIERAYVNEKARRDLGWQRRYDFQYILDRLKARTDLRSSLCCAVGSKGYHVQKILEGLYPVE